MRVIANYAEMVIRDEYESYVSQKEDNLLSIEEWAVNEATLFPNFHRWLFDDNSIANFGSNLSDEEMKMASNFFKTL